MRWFLIVITALSVAAIVAQIVTVFNQVKPVEGLWNPLVGTLQFSPEVAEIEGNVIGGKFSASMDCLYTVLMIYTSKLYLRSGI